MRLIEKDLETLEKMVDAHSLAGVLSSLYDICLAKAEHLESNWQDRQSAKVWERMAERIDKAMADECPV